MALEPGSTLGPYEVLALIGAGGMGEVYLAREISLGRNVALKVLPPEFTHDAQRVARFEQEARSASALSHPNICTIFALGELPDGRRFIAMEYVEGETLRYRIATSRLTIREAIEIATQVAAALSAAHAAGIVHRDIKPENVMLRPDGFIKVLDFGLAKLTGTSDASAAESTQTAFRTDAGTVVGTIAYMSPEQARGHQVDARTDIWALGTVLYEMVAGRSPFAAQSTSDLLAAILDRDPAPLARFEPGVPPELQRLVTKALRKDRGQRFQHIGDLLLDLQALREELQIQARSGGGVSPQPAVADQMRTVSGATVVAGEDHRRRTRVTLAAATALLVGFIAFAVWWWVGRSRPATATVSTPVQRNLTRLTFGPGLQTDVTFSPDGRFIAYASDRTGNFDIWVQPVAGGDAVQITRSSADETQPDWSPDGSTLVFRSEREGGGLFAVPALGGIERHLTSFGAVPSWSSDSREITFVAGIGPGDGEWPLRLYVVSGEGGSPRELLREFLTNGRWYWIGRHPDGRISALGRHRQLGPALFTMATDGTRLVRSKEPPEFPLRVFASGIFVRRRFQWYPSGTALLLQTESRGVYNLWRVRVDPRTLTWLSAERLTTGPGADVAGVLSRDGSRTAFTTESASVRLWAFPLDSRSNRLSAGEPLTEAEAIVSNSTLSPDGQFVLYNLSRPGMRERSELWLTSVLDNSSELVTTNAIHGCWSPDSRMLAYVRFSRSETRLAIRELRGKERFVGQPFRAMFVPTDWSADGKLLGSSFADGDVVLALWPTANPRASRPEQVLLARPGMQFWEASFSPNRRWLSFVLQRPNSPGENQIVVAPASDPSRWTQVAANHPWPDKPRWSRDGRTLYFISRWPRSYFNLWAMSFDAERGIVVGQPFALSGFKSPRFMISPDVDQTAMSVSARQAILTMKSVSGNIWMLDNVDK
jgi:Tol biopolymer transport system component/predicted Ser/Thr protein kinase